MAVASTMALAGCYGTVGHSVPVAEASVGVPATLADEVPLYIDTYPRFVYQGSYVYLVDNDWYYPSAGRWYVLREEPRELARYRTSLPPRSYTHPRGGDTARPPAYMHPRGGYTARPPAYTHPRSGYTTRPPTYSAPHRQYTAPPASPRPSERSPGYRAPRSTSPGDVAPPSRALPRERPRQYSPQRPLSRPQVRTTPLLTETHAVDAGEHQHD